jgi:hypothetical protein
MFEVVRMLMRMLMPSAEMQRACQALLFKHLHGGILLDVNLDYSTALLVEKHIHGITLPEAHKRA